MIVLEDVILRSLEPRDVAELYRIRNDWAVIQYLGGFSAGYSMANLGDWLTTHSSRPDERMWAIADRATDTCIGHVGLYQIDLENRRAEVGILLGDARRWGSGIGSRVTRAVAEIAFTDLHIHRLSLKVLAGNARAIRMYERTGFREDAVLRDEQFRDGHYQDVIVMSILEDQWVTETALAGKD